MRIKLRLRLIKFLQKWLNRLLRDSNEFQRLQRVESVADFFYSTLPALDERLIGKAICEGGKWNYFELPSGDYPYYDFILPEIPLYVCVPGVVSASWPEARERGIIREVWESAQADLLAIEEGTTNMSTINMAAQPKVIILKWDEPINHHYLMKRLEEVLKTQ